MGWKASAIFAAEEQGYFGSLPPHDAHRADAIRDRLGLIKYERGRESDLDSAMHPRGGALYIAAYPRGTIICESDLPSYLFDEHARMRITGATLRHREFISGLLQLYPQGEVLAIVAHSVVGLWGYSLYAKGVHLRTAAGASDEGLFANSGAPLPEESRILAECPMEQVEEQGWGEELVFDVSARMMGKRFDDMDNFNPVLSEYKKKKRTPLSMLKQLLRRT